MTPQTNTDALVERIAETVWRAEFMRSTGRDRLVPWCEINETDRERYRFIARAIAAMPEAAALASKEPTNG